MGIYRVTYYYSDGTVERHEVEAANSDDAYDTAQPDNPGAEIERMEVRWVRPA